ncbi:hypothetical protein M0811_09162 [Anaeramoeba ignava]|uniref:BTB domain-containing protein n=1 Tax=Anaeramoeba ignava TaxID=1746090 RepID=A0A9Q0LHM8_ANAIG|nr:hypothetical protein M0811_09162 [Anaeramoeba ignava]
MQKKEKSPKPKALNDILSCGKNVLQHPNSRDFQLKLTRLKIIEKKSQIQKIQTNNFSTIFLFQNHKAIEYSKQNLEKIQIEKIQIENIQKVTVGFENVAILTKEGNVFAKGKDINPRKPKEFINISSLIEYTNNKLIEDTNDKIIEYTNDKIIKDTNDKIIEDTNDKLIKDTNDKIIEDINDKIIKDTNDKIIEYTNDKLIKYTNDKIIEDINDKIIKYTNDKIIKYTNDKIIKYTNDKIIKYTNDKIIEDTNDKIIEDTNDKIIKDTNDKIIKDTNDKIIEDTNDKLIKDTNDKIIEDTNDKIIKDTNDKIIKDTNDKIIEDTNDKIIKDTNDKIIKDTNDKLIEDTNNRIIEDTNDRIIEDIVSGAYSIYLLTPNHNAYGIGLNDFGQLGFDSYTLPKTEKPILMMKNVSKIFSGNFSLHVFLLNSNQELFVCGNNKYGQAGCGFEVEKITDFLKIKNIPKGKIIDIQCGFAHSMMLIENEDEYPKRKLYSCGVYPAHGIDLFPHLLFEFTEIKSPLFKNDNILEISCGYSHTLILTSKKNVISFGNNNSGQIGTGNIGTVFIPTKIELPDLIFNDEFSSYHCSCGTNNSLIYSTFVSNLEEDLIKLFRRKEFCDISFKTRNGEIIEAHKLILKYRLNQNEIEKLKEIISNKSIKESNQIFEMIYSSRIINPKLYSEIKEIINLNEKIEETMKRIYLNENEKDFIIERKEKEYKFPKLILIMRSDLYRGMFLSVTEDKSNKVTDYSELSNKSFQIFEYWIYSNQIKDEIQITQEMIEEIKIGIDYFQLNET